ncbi:MAG: hypothetical protein R3D69_12835 [Xanthobacteraceae bacterium]
MDRRLDTGKWIAFAGSSTIASSSRQPGADIKSDLDLVAVIVAIGFFVVPPARHHGTWPWHAVDRLIVAEWRR